MGPLDTIVALLGCSTGRSTLTRPSSLLIYTMLSHITCQVDQFGAKSNAECHVSPPPHTILPEQWDGWILDKGESQL